MAIKIFLWLLSIMALFCATTLLMSFEQNSALSSLVHILNFIGCVMISTFFWK